MGIAMMFIFIGYEDRDVGMCWAKLGQDLEVGLSENLWVKNSSKD
jgi:hypothetical protein